MVVKFKAIFLQYVTLCHHINKNKVIPDIRYENESLNEETRVKLSEKIIMKCPECDYEQTCCYSSLRDFFLKGTNFCVNTECKYFCKGRKIGLFDVKKKCEIIGQEVLDKEYTNSRNSLHLKCKECKTERKIYLFSMKFGCVNMNCKYNNIGWGEKTGETIKVKYHKIIPYEQLISNYGYKVIGKVPKVEEDKVTIECIKGHIIDTSMMLFRNFTNNRKKIMCEICDVDEKYEYIKDFADKNNFYLDTPRTECDDICSVKFIFRCKNNDDHCCKIKKVEVYNLDKLDCILCKNNKEEKEDILKIFAEIEARTSHTNLSYRNKDECEFTCGNCGTVSTTSFRNLKANKGGCVVCYRSLQKTDIEIIKTKMTKFGFTLEKYESKDKVHLICKNNHKFISSVYSITKRNRGCPKCAPQKREETNLEKYGVKNVFQNEEIKEKIKETSLKKYGHTHHLQNPEQKNKLIKTCLEKFGVAYAFCQPQVYEKIKKTHLEKYGVEYPLQSQEIQDKITEIFMKKYNVPRPVLSEKFKEDMLKKYGNIYHVNTKNFKKVMLEKYGVEHALQNKELFHKTMKNAFSSKELILPKTNRKIEVMGFESQAILHVLSEFNTILNRNINEEEILVGTDVPTFAYTDDENKKHIYYPDFCISGTKLIYEVKSTYTFNLDCRKNFLKFKEVAKQGYTICILIYKNKKHFHDIWIFEGDTQKSVKYPNKKTFDVELLVKDKEIKEYEEEQIIYEIIKEELCEVKN